MRTKVIATIGPSSDSVHTIRQMISAGMNIARINASHATHPELRRRVKIIRQLSKQLRRPVQVMLDLQGPRLRVGHLPKAGRLLSVGETVIFDTKLSKQAKVIHIDDPYLHTDIRVGRPLFLSSGQIELTVTNVTGTRITAKVVRGGHLYSRKGVNVPGTGLTTSGLTDKDITDVKVGAAVGVDMIALSFVQSANDVNRLREIIGPKIPIIAKIEMAVALRHITEILETADGIMVARGDLGIETPVEDVPFLQKSLIRQAMWHGKASIVATQMLLSMTDNPHPTRAEVSDVANAVLDGADAVMLSDETASGNHPVAAITTMERIVRRAESERLNRPNPFEDLTPATFASHRQPVR